MLGLEHFIERHVTGRAGSMFAADEEAHRRLLSERVRGKRTLVIGGAGSIGTQFCRQLARYAPAQLVVVDSSENALTELTRDLRSTPWLEVPPDYRTYPIAYSDPMFRRIFEENGGFDIVANFSAHKHVRSERDRYSVRALLENNVLRAKGLMDLLAARPPERFFCVSTDKAANPVNIMGASKKLMEELVMAYADRLPVTSARFANVAFSQGSLPAGWLQRLEKLQPLVAPTDVRRYFVSPRESGQLCLLACVLGAPGEVFFPRLREEDMRTFAQVCDAFLAHLGLRPEPYTPEQEAEAKLRAGAFSPADRAYPVVYTQSDTTGEKPYEEFYTEGERVNLGRFAALGVIEDTPRRPLAEVDAMLEALRDLLARPDFTKAEVVSLLSAFLPSFTHRETGRSLDDKM